MRDTRRPRRTPTPTTASRHSPRSGGIIRAKAAHDSPAGPDDAHDAVIAAEDQAVGAGADGGDLVAFEEGAGAAAGVGVVVVVGGGRVGGGGMGVVGELDLGCVEEVEGPPLGEGWGLRLVKLVGWWWLWLVGVGRRGGETNC